MLDVHPPHRSAHTWREFFVHIATIVVGLLIAVALEQAVEAVHRHQERVNLIEDLRQEANARTSEIRKNDQSYLVMDQWLSKTLHNALAAKEVDSYVVFTLPPPVSPTSGNLRPATAVWAAARSSGIVGVLSRSESEDWERVDYFAQLAQHDTEVSQASLKAVLAVCDHLGAEFTAGASIRTTAAGRDELTKALGVVIEALRSLRHDNEETLSATEAVLHPAKSGGITDGSPKSVGER